MMIPEPFFWFLVFGIPFAFWGLCFGFFFGIEFSRKQQREAADEF